MSKNFSTTKLNPIAMYSVSIVDTEDGSTDTKEMTGADLKRLSYAIGHLYDLYAEEVKRVRRPEEEI